MDLGLSGRTAIVLGSTAGLGRAIAEGLAAEGANVVVTGRRGNLAKEIAATLPNALGVEVDLSNPESVNDLVRIATDAYGQIDAVVLNAGGPPPGGAETVTPDSAARSLETLLLRQLELVNAVLPGMRERQWGRIVAVGSSGVQAPIANLAHSNLARAALAAYLKTLASEVASSGITVNMVLPGRIATDRIAELDADRARRTDTDIESVRIASCKSIPVGRYGHPQEFADVAVFLCSDRASYVTGSQVRVDGGLIASL